MVSTSPGSEIDSEKDLSRGVSGHSSAIFTSDEEAGLAREGDHSSSPSIQDSRSLVLYNGPKLPETQAYQHSTLGYLSLVEGRCRTQAAKALNASRRARDHFSEDAMEVQDLSRHIFAETTKELHRAGMIPNEYVGRDLEELRAQYLSSFDSMLFNIASKRAPTVNKAIDESQAQSVALTESSSVDVSLALALRNPGLDLERDSRNQNLLNSHLSSLQSIVMADDQGRKLSRSIYATEYKELRLLGKGGFGHAFQALNIIDNQIYAVKKIPIFANRYDERSEERMEALLSEVRTLAKLNHPNIVRYYHGWVELCDPLSVGTTSRSEDFSETQHSVSLSLQMSNMNLDIERQLQEDTLKSDFDDYGSHDFFDRSESPQQLLKTHESSKSNELSTPKAVVKKSFFESSNSVSSEVESIPRDDSRQLSAILYIKMALYSLTLEEYLWPDNQPSKLGTHPHHCFHNSSSVKILLSLLDGIDYMHSQGKIHRDLKPANIFLSVHQDPVRNTNGSVEHSYCANCVDRRPQNSFFVTPHIGDFGLVAEREDDTNQYTEDGRSSMAVIVAKNAPGTKFYNPPTPNSTICPKLDVYSLGVMAFELVYQFGTKSERSAVLHKLREGALPMGFEKHEMAPGIMSMLCDDRAERWDCAKVRRWLTSL